MRKYLTILILMLILIPTISVNGQQIGFNGQAVGTIGINPSDPFQILAGTRYLPKLTYRQTWEKGYELDAEVSLNIWGSGLLWRDDSIAWDGDIEPYRVWIRFSTKRFEARLGLQKINFGSAAMLRPLMWFDQIDPRDPLQLTDGVYSLLFRYYFLNNANIWVWGLYGNEGPKGWEVFPTGKKNTEYGGRVQLPFLKGEVAASYHHRTVDVSSLGIDSLSNINPFPEDRIGLDGKVDIGIGLWFESSFVHQNHEEIDYAYRRQINIGSDYTFGIGNGINIVAEYFYYSLGEDFSSSNMDNHFGGISANYPITIIHNLSAIIFYDFTNNGLYRFANYSMTYDKWIFYIMAFWNPDVYQIYNIQEGTNIFSGYGIQLMAVFNH